MYESNNLVWSGLKLRLRRVCREYDCRTGWRNLLDLLRP